MSEIGDEANVLIMTTAFYDINRTIVIQFAMPMYVKVCVCVDSVLVCVLVCVCVCVCVNCIYTFAPLAIWKNNRVVPSIVSLLPGNPHFNST